MSDMISVATGFQSSVNIAYDINDDKKLKNYIPTKSALQLLEAILLSTGKDSTDRARILIGAYGKGKSHIVLMVLSLLMKKDISLFEKLIPVIKKEKPELYQVVRNYYDKDIPTYKYDGSLVMGNLLNAATSLGLGSIWVHRAKEEFESEFGKKILADLGIEGNYEGIGHCAIGYAAAPANAPAPRKDNYVYYVR